MTVQPGDELPDTAMATGNDYEPGIPPGPLDPEERAVLDELRHADGPDVVAVADEDLPEYADAVSDETIASPPHDDRSAR
ncbi:hypothetical protein [Pseudonocardia humida]|uniref:DUF5709 domain-containing protein n=1 Tax=Pseudonocardia humida TaxID=2800819 RepID=A0ABT0ZTC2_9PSEU|nr:hypothetical protein [Pseudonocardia humida]MCO1653939.1 hypothetical protein [Pseudonocardia humida]